MFNFFLLRNIFNIIYIIKQFKESLWNYLKNQIIKYQINNNQKIKLLIKKTWTVIMILKVKMKMILKQIQNKINKSKMFKYNNNNSNSNNNNKQYNKHN